MKDSTISFIQFQSTRPMRGATTDHYLLRPYAQFQSTRPMRGATKKVDRG